MSAAPSRRQSRELALQVLFQMDQQGQSDVQSALQVFQQSYSPNHEAWAYARRLIEGVSEHRSALDLAIQQSSAHWRLERMPSVDLAILRIGAFEILFAQNEIPPKGAINEAIELGKIYSTADSGKFINGVLDQIRKSAPATGGS